MAKSSVSKTDAEVMTKEEIPNLQELSEDIVAESVGKQWKTHGKAGAEKASKKCQKSRDKKKMTTRQLQNLRQFREKDESSEEAKQASLEQLRIPVKKDEEVVQEKEPTVDFPPEVLEPDLIRNVLTIDEQKYFVRRWQEYMSEHQRDFNAAEDYDTIMELIMNYIQLYRIEKKQKNAPSLVYDRSVDFVKHNIHIRIRNLHTSLKTRRKDRLETKESRQSQMLTVISELAKDSQSSLRETLEKRLEEQLLSEEDMIRRKRQRLALPNANE